MNDDPNDTLTTIEARVLCLRYGLKDIDASSSEKKLRKHQTEKLSPSSSRKDVARTLGSDKDTIKNQEMAALKKLNITR